MTNLIVENLSVMRNGRPVLQDISFTAQAGEFIGLIGPNGTGKTTLMRAMLGLLPHTGQCNLSSLSADAKAKLVSWLPQARGCCLANECLIACCPWTATSWP